MLLLLAAAATLWTPPKPVEVPSPQAPYTYLREDLSGTQPKLSVRDTSGRSWNVKFGFEVRTESFCWRIVEACGYFTEPSFFVAEGKFERYRPLERHSDAVTPDGRFREARFQLRDPGVIFLKGRDWRWDRPPFAGTKELNGLKILIMLFSNWDNKDARVGKGGPNTAEFQAGKQRFAAFTDWGSGMGKWGSVAGANSNWNCADFTLQTPLFVAKMDPKEVVFGWEGAINDGFRSGIPPEHVAWLMTHLGQVSDAQLREWLRLAGGSDADVDCFSKALRARIDRLRSAAESRP